MQVLGEAVVIQGSAALDVYRVLTEGIAAVRRRDHIEPSQQLLEAVAGLRLASSASLASSEVGEAAPARTLRSGRVVGVTEVGQLLGVGDRQVTHLAPSLGGWRGSTRGRPWRFDEGLVLAYIEQSKIDTERMSA